ncbi:MAG: hypothetical protein GY765_42710, partial [bacterium]|nr:hypothetical protein [bacterium]
LLLLIFGLQCLSRLLSVVGSRTGKAVFYKYSAYSFPIEADSFSRYGQALFAEIGKSGTIDAVLLQRTSRYLKNALFRNKFYYRPHFYLGRSYLMRTPLEDDVFKLGIDCLKRAIRLQGSKDIVMSTHVVQLMLTHWQRISSEEQKTCRSLFKEIISRIDESTFAKLLETWEKNSRDIEIFQGVLEQNPQYYNMVAEALARLETDIKLRHIFKSNHEIYLLEELKPKYNLLSANSAGYLNELMSFRSMLKKRIIGFHRLIENNKFKRQNYRDLLKLVNFRILHHYFTARLQARPSPANASTTRTTPGTRESSKPDTAPDTAAAEVTAGADKENLEQEKILVDFINQCLKDLTVPSELEELREFLKRRQFFTDSPDAIYVKAAISLNMKDYPVVINQLEPILNTFPENDDAGVKEYVPIFLLLSDTYISSRLMIKAKNLLLRIEKWAPKSLEFYRQKMKTEHIMQVEINGRKSKFTYYENMKNSRFLQVTSLPFKADVYLVEDKFLEIQTAAAVKKTMKGKHLFQVFVDNQIMAEYYLGSLSEPIKIDLSRYDDFARHTIRIEIL